MLSPALELKNKPEFSLLIEDIWRRAREGDFKITYTPMLEDPSILMRAGQEVDGLTFKVLKRGDKLTRALESSEPLYDSVLRYDQTVGLENFLKSQGLYTVRRCQVGPVWRAERQQKGRYKEFWQADFDILDKDPASANILIASLIMDILKTWLPDNLKLYMEANIINDDDASLLTDFLEKTGAFLSPELARGQSYYRGVIWEIKIAGQPLSLAGGGCYTVLDNRRAAGGGLGLERLLLNLP